MNTFYKLLISIMSVCGIGLVLAFSLLSSCGEDIYDDTSVASVSYTYETDSTVSASVSVLEEPETVVKESDPVKEDEPEPKAAEEPKPAEVDEPKPVVADEPEPAVTDEPEPVEEVKPEVTYKFRSKRLLDEHYEKHGIEMGFATKDDYVAAANKVINNPDSLHKLEKEDGDDVYYLEETNEFVVVSTDGFIRTYFCPDSGKKYFDKQ